MNRLKSEEIDIGISGVRKLTELVRQKYNFDLSMYSATSLKRRISSLIIKNGLKNLDDLLHQLQSDKGNVSKFHLDIGVEGTEFFRDPAFWRCFRDDTCRHFRSNQSVLKVWIPGCFNSEEVISTAITLKEAGLYDKTQIIATDLNQAIIDHSRNKVYSNSIFEISENNYKRFREDDSASLSTYINKDPKGFTFQDDLYRNISYQVIPNMLEARIRSVNMIIYRNHFIYYTAQYQEKLLEVFTRNLAVLGILAIGNKENISFCKDASNYQVVNDSEKIFKRIT